MLSVIIKLFNIIIFISIIFLHPKSIPKYVLEDVLYIQYYTTFSSDLLRTPCGNNFWYYPEKPLNNLIIPILIKLGTNPTILSVRYSSVHSTYNSTKNVYSTISSLLQFTVVIPIQIRRLARRIVSLLGANLWRAAQKPDRIMLQWFWINLS